MSACRTSDAIAPASPAASPQPAVTQNATEAQPSEPAPVLPESEIPDTPDNQRVIAFCERYRSALEARDANQLVALASPRYRDDQGTPSADDDVDHDALRKSLTRMLRGVQSIRYEIRYRRITREHGRIHVDYTYGATFVTNGTPHSRLDDAQLVLELHQDSFLILSGM